MGLETGPEENRATFFLLSHPTLSALQLSPSYPSSLLPHGSWAPSLSLQLFTEPKDSSVPSPHLLHPFLPFLLSLVTLLASPLLFAGLCGPRSCCQTSFNVLCLSLFSLSSLRVPPVCCCSCLLPGGVGYLYATGLHPPHLSLLQLVRHLHTCFEALNMELVLGKRWP